MVVGELVELDADAGAEVLVVEEVPRGRADDVVVVEEHPARTRPAVTKATSRAL